MAVLEKLLKTKLPSGEELSKKLLKGKLFTKRGAKPAETTDEAATPATTQVTEAVPEPAAKPKKPSLADKAQLAKALLKARKSKGPESYGGPTSDRIARALRRDQLEPQFDFAPPPRIFASPPDAAAILPPPVMPPLAPAEAGASLPQETPGPSPAPVLPPVLSEAEVSAALQAVTAPVVEESAAAPARPAADPREAAILVFAGEAELEITALAAALEHRTGLSFEITEDGRDLHLHVEELTVLISQQHRALSEAELLNLLYPDEEEWEKIGLRFSAMNRHISVSALGTAATLPDLRHRTTVMAGVVVALLDLMPSCLGTIWPLGASLIAEVDFRELALALAEPVTVELAEPAPTAEAPLGLEETPATEPEAEPDGARNPQAEAAQAPRA